MHPKNCRSSIIRSINLWKIVRAIKVAHKRIIKEADLFEIYGPIIVGLGWSSRRNARKSIKITNCLNSQDKYWTITLLALVIGRD